MRSSLSSLPCRPSAESDAAADTGAAVSGAREGIVRPRRLPAALVPEDIVRLPEASVRGAPAWEDVREVPVWEDARVAPVWAAVPAADTAAVSAEAGRAAAWAAVPAAEAAPAGAAPDATKAMQ